VRPGMADAAGAGARLDLAVPAGGDDERVVDDGREAHAGDSVCPSGSPIVYLHSPSVFHSLIVLSRAPDTICARRGDNRVRIGLPIVYLHSPSVFHSLIVLSRAPDTICARVRRQQGQDRVEGD